MELRSITLTKYYLVIMVASFFFVVVIIDDYSGSWLSNKLTLLVQSLRNIIIILLILICELSNSLCRFHLHGLSLLNH